MARLKSGVEFVIFSSEKNFITKFRVYKITITCYPKFSSNRTSMVKAAVLKAPEDIRTDEFPFPDYGTVIKIEAAGVCGTDPHVYNNTIETQHPLIMGHELLGIIQQLDEETLSNQSDRICPGDRVFIAPGIDCNECFYCENVGSLCSDRKFYGINITSEAPPHLRWGIF
jgi:D-arabinose 1-dehydrogenase-like Zn-dependent alcohol dehydrogenase